MPAITIGTTAVRRLRFCVALTTTLVCLVVWSPKSTAAEKEPVDAPAASPRLFEQHGAAAPLDADAYIMPQPKVVPRQVNFQPPNSATPRPIKPLIVNRRRPFPHPPHKIHVAKLPKSRSANSALTSRFPPGNCRPITGQSAWHL